MVFRYSTFRFVGALKARITAVGPAGGGRLWQQGIYVVTGGGSSIAEYAIYTYS